ncbi:hypothetical protein JL720_12951 [Aureococcus anophagefferens]|nr:hypothetical protein JL720_12951 [Aureococcus anophagefferens]
MQKECIDPLAPPLALYEPATLDKFDRAGGPPEALTGGLCGRPASLPPAPVDGALPPREPREAIGELPKYILNRPDADAPANRPPATRRTLVYTYADGAVAAPPEDAPEPGGATAAYVFESRFESGNLLHAAVVERDYGGAAVAAGRAAPAEFDCAMCPDVGTGGHTQWFYFRVDGLRKGVRYRFNVTNFAKADSLYLEGMQPLVYGVGAAKSGVGWRRAGKVVCYSKNTAEAHRQQVADMRRASGLAIDGGDDGEESSGSGSASDGESDGGGDGAAPDGDGAKPESKPPSLPSSDNDNNGTDTPREPTPREQRKKKEAEKPSVAQGGEAAAARAAGTHTLSFDLTLDDDEPSLYLAYSHPYTYTDLQAFLATLADPARSATYTRRSLCDTVAGNRCDLLTITAPPAASAPAEAPPPGRRRRPAAGRRRQGGRVAAAAPRRVELAGAPGRGNYRCSNSGMDLNRQWSAPSREAHPPVAALKHLIRMYQARRDRRALLRFARPQPGQGRLPLRHPLGRGPLRPPGAAVAGQDARVRVRCREMTEKATKKPFDAAAVAAAKEAVAVAAAAALAAATQTGTRGTEPARGRREPGWRRSSARRPALPLVLAKAAYGMFTKKKTTFRLGRGKAGTARAVVCRELGVRRSYTLEVSFMGGVAGRHRDAQFTTRDLLDLGGQWCAALVDFFGLTTRSPRWRRRRGPRRRPPRAGARADRGRAAGRRRGAGAGEAGPAKRPPRPKPAPSANFAPPANAAEARETAAPKKDDGAADAARAPAPAPGKPAAARPKLGRRASGTELEPAEAAALKARLAGRTTTTVGGVAAPGPTSSTSTTASSPGDRDQPAPRVSFNMSRPGSRASLNFPVVPAAANAPPAEGAAPALPERRPEPPPDSRPSSNDADHRKHRTLSDEKSAS